MERVPAGARFDFEMIYTIYDQHDRDNLRQVFEAMQLLEDDYLGGHGSRGSGKVSFEALAVQWRSKAFYESGKDEDAKKQINGAAQKVADILNNFVDLKTAIKLAGE
jgi:CRISPR-associated protein Csm3